MPRLIAISLLSAAVGAAAAADANSPTWPATGNVGIGTTTPASMGSGGSPRILQINGVTGTVPYGLLGLSTVTPAPGQPIGGIEFGVPGVGRTSAIYSVCTTASPLGGYLGLYTGIGGSLAERLHINDNGDVTINNNLGVGGAPGQRFDVYGPLNTNVLSRVIGQGTGLPYFQLYASGGVAEMQASAAGDLIINANGVASGVATFYRAGATANSLVVRGGKVGIGTSTPQSALDVFASGQSMTLNPGNAAVRVRATADGAANPLFLNVGYDPTIDAGYLQGVHSGTGGFYSPLFLNPNGGTLHVGGGTDNVSNTPRGLSVQDNDPNANVAFGLGTGTGSSMGMVWNGVGKYGALYTMGNSWPLLYTAFNHQFLGGNVAIGGAPLGGVKLSIVGSSASSNALGFSDTNAGGKDWFMGPGVGSGSPGAFSLYNATNPATLMTVTSDGNLGLGTTAPASMGSGGRPTIFQINGTGSAGSIPYGLMELSTSLPLAGNPIGQVDFGVPGQGRTALITSYCTSAAPLAGYLSFYTAANVAPVERMRITEAGNIGIGTPTPVGRFHAMQGSSSLYFKENTNAELWLQSTSNVYADLHFATVGADQCFLRGSTYGLNVTGANPRLSIGGTDVNRIGTALYVKGLSQFDGNVGIGTPSPSNVLTVVSTTNAGARLDISSANAATGAANLVLSNANTTVGNASGIEFVNGGGGPTAFISGVNYNHNINGSTTGGLDFSVYNAGALSHALVIAPSGNIGIGVSAPTSALAVNGVICAKEIKVVANPADYVFADGYRLRPLTEVEAFITAHKHLPGVPSAKEQEENGELVADLMRAHLEKIEELNLYAIAAERERQRLEERATALDKVATALVTRNAALEASLAALAARLERLEAAAPQH